MFIYRIVNIVNNKEYIGKTVNINRRFTQHVSNAKRGYNNYLYRAIRKYGAKSFIIEILHECERVEDMNDREKYYISVRQPEYNMTQGGDGGHIYDQSGNTWKVKDSSQMGKTFRRGENHTDKWKQSVVGGNNYQCNTFIHTPWGTFETWKDAIEYAKILRRQGREDVVTDKTTLRKYCTEDVLLSKEGRRTFPAWRGKNTKQLGFFIEDKYVDQ